MRIIGGEARSRSLVSPDGMDTRPTLDQVRESLFNILRMRVSDAQVLDLYAGSGALALEALSRGASRAVLCDISRDACRAIRKNIESLGYQDRACLLAMPDDRALGSLIQEKAVFDLIFLDPPYRMDPSAQIRVIMDGGLLQEDGLIIVEHALKTPPDNVDNRLERKDFRKYRDTGVSFYGRKRNGQDTVSVSGQF